MRHPRQVFTGMQHKLSQLPAFLRLLIVAWLAAGAIYFMLDLPITVIPVGIASVLVLPFIVAVFILMGLILYSGVYLLVGPKGR